MRADSLVFVDVDTQRDFMTPTGALYVFGAEAIVPRLARLTRFARDHQVPILATADAHTLDEPDPEPFPPHCLLGTPGQERIEATAWPDGTIVPVDGRFDANEAVHDRPPAHLTIHKRRYDVFSHPEADRIVSLHARPNPTFVVYGVATDYCVRAVVEGLLARSHRVALVVDAVRAVDPAAEPALLTSWARNGVLLTTTDALCGPS